MPTNFDSDSNLQYYIPDNFEPQQRITSSSARYSKKHNMPHALPVTKSGLDEANNTLSDYPESSYREPSVVFADHDKYLSRCRWYGEEFFRFSMRLAIFKNAGPDSTAEDLKLEQSEAEIDFPYQDFIEKLDAIKATKISEGMCNGIAKPYTTFITKLGAVADQVDHDIRNRLSFMIQTFGGFEAPAADHDNTMPRSSPPPDNCSAGGHNSIALCTTKLHEWAAAKQKSISCSGEQISIEPPLNEVVVLLDGEKFVARAKKQKMAKHIACQEACERFGIIG